MSPDGQKALIAGGLTAFGSKHIGTKITVDQCNVPLPDLFELDLATSCWVQVGSHSAMLCL